MKIILFILFILAVLFILLPSIIIGIIRFIITMLGGGTSTRNYNGGAERTQRRGEDERASYGRPESSDSGKKKVFDSDEGEYVSFEEIDKTSDNK